MVYPNDEMVISDIVHKQTLSPRILMLYLSISLASVKRRYNVLRYHSPVLIVSLAGNNFVEYCAMWCPSLVWVCVFYSSSSHRRIKACYCNRFCNRIYPLVGDWPSTFSMVRFASFIASFQGSTKWTSGWNLERSGYVQWRNLRSCFCKMIEAKKEQQKVWVGVDLHFRSLKWTFDNMHC